MIEVLAPDEKRLDREAAGETFRSLPKGGLLLGYQRRTVDLLMAGTALLVIEKSRRIGLTWGVAAFATLKASSAIDAGGQNIWYMGYNKEMAREFIEVCAMWARAFSLVAGELEEEDVLDEDTGQPVTTFSIRLASGFRITALPSVPSVLRGKQGIFVCDEAAFIKNLGEVLKAAMAFLVWGGQVVIISTHDGVTNAFNMLLDEIKAGKRRGVPLKITFADALEAGLYERVALVAKAKGTELPAKEQWEADIRAAYGDDAAEELDCIPKIGAGSLISLEDIIAAEHDDCGQPELYAGGPCYLGRDVARRRDGQIQLNMELIGDVLWERDGYREVGQTFAHQDAFFDAMFATRRIVQAMIDQTGMGEKVVEDAQRRHGALRVVGVLLTGPNRVDLALGLAKRFQERKIRIAPSPRTRADLMAIKKLGSEQSGTIRIVNDGEVHADEFWAYGLASRACDLGGGYSYGYEPVRRSRGGAFGDDDDDDEPGRGWWKPPLGSRMSSRGAF